MSDYEFSLCLDALQMRYVRALDTQDMATWVDCFGAEASYVCTTRENVEQDLPLALMMDDSRARIQDRANYVTKVWAGTFEAYATRHFVQRLSLTALSPSRFEIESNFMVAYTGEKGRSGVLAAGLYRDTVRLDDGVARFEAKEAVLDTVTPPRYLVYPI